jgi:ABC-type branched-subunit amino acid transport system ATPase component
MREMRLNRRLYHEDLTRHLGVRLALRDQLQNLQFARALMNRPTVLLVDEPTTLSACTGYRR